MIKSLIFSYIGLLLFNHSCYSVFLRQSVHFHYDFYRKRNLTIAPGGLTKCNKTKISSLHITLNLIWTQDASNYRESRNSTTPLRYSSSGIGILPRYA